MSTGRSKCYIVALELNSDTVEHESLFEVFDSFTRSTQVLSSMWTIETGISREQIALALLKRMGPSDRLIMAECSSNKIWVFKSPYVNASDHPFGIN